MKTIRAGVGKNTVFVQIPCAPFF